MNVGGFFGLSMACLPRTGRFLLSIAVISKILQTEAVGCGALFCLLTKHEWWTLTRFSKCFCATAQNLGYNF